MHTSGSMQESSLSRVQAGQRSMWTSVSVRKAALHLLRLPLLCLPLIQAGRQAELSTYPAL